MSSSSQILISTLAAFLGGILPTFIWLFFWTREDKKNPEPKSMIALAFIGGMIAVFISLLLEKYFYGFGPTLVLTKSIFNFVLPWLNYISMENGVSLDKILLVGIIAPVVEELMKFFMAYILVLRSKEDDEPLDPMIYMITTALGFAAAENVLFLLYPLIGKNSAILAVFTGDMRFIGSTLLHTISSATIAMFISFHFFDGKIKKFFFCILGIICAVIMHGIFNFLMIGSQSSSIFALELIWIVAIIILLAFEKIKKIRQQQNIKII